MIGEITTGGTEEHVALGEAMNIAARLQGVAQPNQVVVSDATLRLVPGLFLTRDLGTPPLKGVTEPIQAHAVLQPTGVRSRLAVDPSRLTPLVGRERELQTLRDRWRQAEAGAGQTVLLRGEAGVGESRLPHALRENLADQPHSWLECHSTSYSQGSAFFPLIELIEQALGFTAEHDPEEKLSRLELGIEASGLSTEEVVPLLAPLLLLPLPDRYPPRQESPALLRKMTIEALVRWVLALSQRQPMVLLAEDLHWCDASTLDFFGLLIEQSARSPLLTLLSFRPEFEPPWSDRPYMTQLQVARLGTKEAVRMILGVGGAASLPETVVQRIVETADGVPLFLEELTKTVVEAGTESDRVDLSIPTTLQSSLMSRLDRLEQGKNVAQVGALLGREFSRPLLNAVSEMDAGPLDEGISELMAADLLYERADTDAPIYWFKHVLIRDTAYESLLRSSRQNLHEKTARILGERFPERVEAEPEYVAHHCERGGLVAEAIEHYQRAGQRAFQRWANPEAIGHLSRAIELLGNTPETKERDRREIGLQLAIAGPLTASKGWTHPESVGAYERAEALTRRVGNVPERPRVLLGLARPRMTLGDFSERTVQLAEDALAAAEQSGDSFLTLSAHQLRGSIGSFRGEFLQAQDHIDQALALYDPKTHRQYAHLVGYDQGPVAQTYAALVSYPLGYPDQALSMSRRATEQAQESRNPFSLMMAQLGVGFTVGYRREFPALLKCGEDLIRFCDRYGLPGQRGWGVVFQNWARCELGEVDEAVDEIQRVIDMHKQLGLLVNICGFLRTLSSCQRKAGRPDDAWKTASEGLEASRTTQQHHQDSALYWLLGELSNDRGIGHSEDAEAYLRRSIDVARQQHAKGFELRAATSLARLWQSQGKTAEARDLLAPVYDWFTEGFDTQDLKDAKALLGELG